MGVLRLKSGYPLPMGATVAPEGVNFALFSKHATSVTLVLFRRSVSDPVAEIRLDPDSNRTGDIWRLMICDFDYRDIEYGYRVDGPWAPSQGHRFDPTTILIDPYAKSLAGGEVWGSDFITVEHDGRKKTHSGYRCRIESKKFDWKNDRYPRIPTEDLVIYELHVRGFTKSPTSSVAHPGTFRGLVEKLPYLKKLGVNAIELMPVHEFFENEISWANPANGSRLVNYWGYSTVAFFAPKSSYAASAQGGQVDEFKELVRNCHEMGIEVILDVVFNHTAEGNETGTTLSFKGLDNKTYYMLGPDGKYQNYSACGNTLNCNHPVVRQMIRDCLRYWVMETHVDGFRFDLASILGRDSDGNPLRSPPLLEAIAHDPILADCKLIAEAWDAGGLYQIGTFPAWGRWGEWNGKFRDTARKFLNGDDSQTPELARRISGSPDLYESGGRRPYHSVNFITCHDGFTLKDLFSYNEKHNHANGEDNRDGANDNYSHNHGVEGDTDNVEINSVRLRQMKNAIVLLFVAQGVPMLYEGDEMGRSKNGNNNSYCHDNELNWVDWTLAEKNSGLVRFVTGMISFRSRHKSLRRRTYFTGEIIAGTPVRDIEWHSDTTGEPDWGTPSNKLAFVIGGEPAHDDRRDPDIYVAFNAGDEDVEFNLPGVPRRRWVKVVDTALDSPHDYNDPGHEKDVAGSGSIPLKRKSSVILVTRDL